MAITIRAFAPDELDTFLLVDRRGFGSGPLSPDASLAWVEAELDRTRCAFDGDEMVACSRAYSFEITVPGGTRLPVAAVSAVAVQPSDRRRGLLTQMIDALHRDARERGEPASILTASESAIYGRFGYGITSWRNGLRAERSAVTWASELGLSGRIRMVERDAAEKIIPRVYEATRGRTGAVSRPDYWWPSVFWSLALPKDKAWFVAVHEDDHGEADGYIAYEIRGEWNAGISDAGVMIWDLQAANREAHAALWRYAFGIDLVQTIRITNAAIDDPVRLLVSDPRRVQTEFVNDGLWLCPLDHATLLGARTYTADGRVVIEVHDPDGTRTRLAVDGGPAGATAAITTESADVECSAATVGACILGGNSWTRYASAGLVDEHTSGALQRADAMFATQPAPAMLSYF